LLTRSYPVMALDSNGLRVLCRVGFAEEQKNYSATYRLAQDAVHGQLPRDYDSLIRAHISCSDSTVKNCASGQSRAAPSVQSEMAATTVGRFD
jgi:hypothetical protein